jgi:RNA-directed DNA polymerase
MGRSDEREFLSSPA